MWALNCHSLRFGRRSALGRSRQSWAGELAQLLHQAHFDKKGGLLMGWMAPAPTGVAMRHNAGVDICL